MVLDDSGHDHVVWGQAQAVSQVVDGFSGVAAEDGDVIRALTPGEGQHRAPGLLEGLGRDL